MNLLYYNWTPLFDPLQRGGGVRIYQEGLIKKAVSEGHAVTYFSAGIRYNLLRPGLRVAPALHAKLGVREFEIINSPIFAPSFHQFGRDVSERDERLYADFLIDFINTEGPFDVIHFNNIEGLPIALFENRSRINAAAVILSLHNYHTLCQQVNLWHDEKVACYDYEEGRRCTRCVVRPSAFEVTAASTFHEIASVAITPGTAPHAAALRFYAYAKSIGKTLLNLRRKAYHSLLSRRLEQGGSPSFDGAKFRLHRHRAVAAINDGIDISIAVSRRVASIFQGAGVRAEKIATLYIATHFADDFDRVAARVRTARRVSAGGPLTIAYLGYARKDKGFFFFLNALEALAPDIKEKVRVVIAARGASGVLVGDKLRGFASWRVIDGYEHRELPALLSDVDLGIVPVVWEDCLPQVAFEFVGNQVPIFVSDMGGAQELVQPHELVFKAADIDDFRRKLSNVISIPSIMNEFWKFETSPILSWHEHWRALYALYECSEAARSQKYMVNLG